MFDQQSLFALYKVDYQDILGQGTFGYVYKGIDRETLTPVAVREVKCGDSVTVSQLEKVREVLVQLHARLDHPNVLTYLQTTLEDDSLWLVSRHCDLGDLQAYMVSRRPRLHTQLDIMIQTVEGLQHLHQSDIVHGALTPSNILLTKEGSDRRVKVADGCLRSAGLPGPATGSQYFRTIEDLEGLPLIQASDVFAVGLIFLSMINFKSAEGLLMALSADDLDQGLVEPLCVRIQQMKMSGSIIKPTALDTREVQKTKEVINGMIQYKTEDRRRLETVLPEMKAIHTDLPRVVSQGGRGQGQRFGRDLRRTELLYQFRVGELVRVMDDQDYCIEVVEPELNWNITMNEAVGEEGYITNVKSQCVTVMFHYGRGHSYLPSVLFKVSEMDAPQPTIYQTKSPFIRGDIVTIRPGLTVPEFKSLQAAIGEKWDDSLHKVIGCRGIVNNVSLKKKTMYLTWVKRKGCTVHIDSVILVSRGEEIAFKAGDTVLTTLNRNQAIQHQSEAGGWVDCMDQCLCRMGEVRSVRGQAALVRTNSGQSGKWWWHFKCLRLLQTGD